MLKLPKAQKEILRKGIWWAQQIEVDKGANRKVNSRKIKSWQMIYGAHKDLYASELLLMEI